MKVDRHILIRYFTGESTEKEKELIHQWLEDDELNKKQFIRERIRFDASVIADENKILSKPAGTKRKIIWNALKIASVILLLTGNIYLFELYQSNRPEPFIQDIYVPAGSRTSLTLPDGSSVWLNANTRLKYSSLFSEERLVELNGEAFFDVVNEQNKPFVVKTDKYNIEVLGTSFNIEAYTNKPNFETALFTGQVKLYNEKDEKNTLYLNAGETASLIENNLKISVTNFDEYRWKDGLIVIGEKSFEEIMIILEKYFDLKIIIISNRVKKLGYRGKFRIEDGIDHCLRVLQKDFHFTYQREEDTNIIYIH